MLKQAYAKAPFFRSMWDLVNEVYARPAANLAEFTMDGMMAICRYFGLDQNKQFAKSSDLGIPGESTQRVLDVVQRFHGNVYVTGHGARQYFDHELFESHGVAIEYMDYQKTPYPQLYGEFTPYSDDLGPHRPTAARRGLAIHSLGHGPMARSFMKRECIVGQVFQPVRGEFHKTGWKNIPQILLRP